MVNNVMRLQSSRPARPPAVRRLPHPLDGTSGRTVHRRDEPAWTSRRSAARTLLLRRDSAFRHAEVTSLNVAKTASSRFENQPPRLLLAYLAVACFQARLLLVVQTSPAD